MFKLRNINSSLYNVDSVFTLTFEKVFIFLKAVFNLLSCLAGQRHVPHPGSKEPDEHRGFHCEGLLRGLH